MTLGALEGRLIQIQDGSVSLSRSTAIVELKLQRDDSLRKQL